MRAHGLVRGFTLEPVEFAANQASLVALQAKRVDIVLQDWVFVSRQRAEGADWTCSPSSAALGAVIAPPGSPVRSVADLRGRRLGVAGTPLDKSWLLLRVYARRMLDLDLASTVHKTFGPPPLLAEQLAAGRLDAVLTYWPFAARGEAAGMRAVLDMAHVLAALGVPERLPMLGYVFSGSWAEQHSQELNAFLASAREARAILATSDAEWDRIAPLTGVANAVELDKLRSWYRRGISKPWNETALQAAEHLYDLLRSIGGPDLVGSGTHLAPGTFWPHG